MSKEYDAIVIGAGLGGLAAATTLAHEGLGVLLLERHNVPGGYATSFVRGRFEFEVALHELSGIGPPERRGNVYRALEHLGSGRLINGCDDTSRARLDEPEFHMTNSDPVPIILGMSFAAFDDDIGSKPVHRNGRRKPPIEFLEG